MAGSASLVSCGSSGNGSPAPTPVPVPAPTPTPTPTPSTPILIGTVSERDRLNVVLNALYVEGQFLSFALTGQGLVASSLVGTGVAGSATGARRNMSIGQQTAERLAEILSDTIAHIGLLRELLGGYAVAQPTIDLSAGGGPFGVISASAGFDSTLDPYAGEASLLLGLFYLSEISTSLVKDLSTNLFNALRTSQLRDVSDGILRTKSGHTGIIRLALYRQGLSNTSVFDRANRISDYRDARDGSDDLDQGIGSTGQPNLLVTGTFGGTFGRTTGQALRLLYLQAPSNLTVSRGGFFPNGVNGILVET